MIDFLIKQNKVHSHFDEPSFILKPKFKIIRNTYLEFKIFLWGDPIFDQNEDISWLPDNIAGIIPALLKSIQGHFYYLVFDNKTNDFIAGNSLFSILPLYYCKSGNYLCLSNSPEIIAQHLGIVEIDKRFILENVLFNYPLFNHSAFQGISLLPANNYLLWEKGHVSFHKHTLIENLFTSPKHNTKFDLDNLSDLFIERSAYYFPDTTYIHALTGGFDGRTLVACAKYHNKDFETYSFGSSDSTDTPVASTLSKRANIPFNHVILDKNYHENHSLMNGLDFISNSSGTATFARAHYLYATKALSKKAKHLVTGNFGSELFRTAHIAGAVISSNLYHLFKAKSFDDAIATLKSSSEKNWLNNTHFEEEWESLIEDLKEFPAFSYKYNALTLNQKFYLTVFEEVFRKYFGAEMVNQNKYLINRTPFLDIVFFKQLLNSRLAGIHSDFFEHNPIKRYKGQMLYSHIIAKTYSDFSDMLMDKGYKPNDLIRMSGKLNIVKSYVKKKIKKYNKNMISPDPFAVRASFLHNKTQLAEKLSSSPFFDMEKLDYSLRNNETSNSFFVALSQSIFFNDIQ